MSSSVASLSGLGNLGDRLLGDYVRSTVIFLLLLSSAPVFFLSASAPSNLFSAMLAI
jgi:hypothetical protein